MFREFRMQLIVWKKNLEILSLSASYVRNLTLTLSTERLFILCVIIVEVYLTVRKNWLSKTRKRNEEKERQNEERTKSNFSVRRIASSEDCRQLCMHGVSDEKSKMRRKKTKQKIK